MAAERFPSFGLATPPAPRAIGADHGIALLKGGQAKPASLLDGVDLDDDAISVEAETAPLVGPFRTELDKRLDAGAPPPMRFDRQPPSSELFQGQRV